MFEKWLRAWRAPGYARTEAAIDDAEPVREATVEHDEEAINDFNEVV